MVFISYAQNFEDVILWRVFKELHAGFYIDVGAAHPDVDSVTRAFYDRGWHGINIEPSSEYYRRLVGARTRDINLNVALGDAPGTFQYFQVTDTGLSTLDRATAEGYQTSGWEVIERSISCLTLVDICRDHAPSDIHFLKVDVEGGEQSVLSGADFTTFRPWVVLVEATRPMSQELNYHDWEPILLSADYRFVYFDGLNRFYVAKEHEDRITPKFDLPPNVFDDFLRAADTEVVRKIAETRADASEQVSAAEIRIAEAKAHLAAEQTRATEVVLKLETLVAEANAQVETEKARAIELVSKIRIQAAEQVSAERLRAIELVAPERNRTQAAERSAASLLNELTSQRETYTEQINALQHEIQSLQKQIQEIHASRSWRVTALPRAVRLLIGGQIERALKEAGVTPFRVERLTRVVGAEGHVVKRAGRLGFYILARGLGRLPGTASAAAALDRRANRLWTYLRIHDSAYLALALSVGPAAPASLQEPVSESPEPEPTHLPVRVKMPQPAIRKIHQFHSGSATGDAITNAMLLMQTWLRNMGYSSEIYVEHRDPALTDALLLLDDLPSGDDYILIVRHSMGHGVCERIISLPANKILFYHNITPPEFLTDAAWAIPYAELGRRQLVELRPHMVTALADSEYNALELRTYGYDNPMACSFLFDIDALLQKASVGRSKQEEDLFTVLFVGRVVASKGQADLVDAFAAFRALWRKPCQLVLVGHCGAPNAPYPLEVRERIRQHGLEDHVVITGSVTDTQLHDYYRQANLYVSLSHHEGFGVPLVEAMAHRVPVIAWPAGAIPYTLGHEVGNEAMLLADRSSSNTALSMMMVAENSDLAAAMVARQLKVLERFRLDRQSPRLLNALANAGAVVPVQAETRAAILGNLWIAITGHVVGSYSLAVVNRTMAAALEKRLPGRTRLIASEPAGHTPYSHDSISALASRPKAMTGPEVIISQHYPVLVPESPADLAIAFTFWEESLLPEEVVRTLGKGFTKIFAPTDFVAKVLIDSGVPIKVETIGFVPDLSRYAEIAKDPKDRDSKKIFTFLHISSCFPRKGVDLLLAAYARAFRSSDEVRLIIKGFPNPHNDVPEQIDNLRQSDPDVAEILMINQDLDQAAVLDLYRQADAMVLPTRGEGFNIPAAEAMAAGLPLIVTGFGGHLDFCSAEEARFLEFQFRPSQSHLATPNSVWVEPDVNDLAAALREVFLDMNSLDGGATGAQASAAKDAIRARLDPSIWADRIARAAVEGLVTSSLPPLQIAWVSTWGVRCGIAEYSRFLVNAMVEEDDPRMAAPIVLADGRTAGSLGGEPVRAVPAWHVGVPESITTLPRVVANLDPDVVVIQHQPGLIEWRSLADFLTDIRIRRRITVVTLHAAQRLMDAGDKERSYVVTALASVSRVLVHRIADIELLHGLGLTANVTLFPQGAPPLAQTLAESEEAVRPSSDVWIGCYGFFLPGKGIPKLIEAISILRSNRPKLRLRLVNSEYPSPLSTDEIAKCQQLAQSLGVADIIDWNTEFTSQEVSLRRLRECNILVMPYDHSQESSSAALRTAMASGVPVAVSPIALFDEAGDAVFRLPGTDVASVVQGVEELLGDLPAQERLRLASARWLGGHEWGLLGRRMKGMLLGLRASSNVRHAFPGTSEDALGRYDIKDSVDGTRDSDVFIQEVKREINIPVAASLRAAPRDIALDYATLTGDPPVPDIVPTGIKGGSRFCRQSDFSLDAFRYWLAQMRQPISMQRKLWEWYFIADALYQRGRLQQNMTGVGFGVGQEPLPALFAHFGCNVLATDLSLETASGIGWAKAGQHASELAALNQRGICEESAFRDRVQFRTMDMNAIPADLSGVFDFCWSSCALEHLGSLEHGLRFVEESMSLLKPGGVAVHTTEYNISSDRETLELPELSLYRKQDLEGLVERLEAAGHRAEPFDWAEGCGFADGFVDLPPYFTTPLHLRLRIADFACTSIGLIVHKSERVDM